VTGYVVSALALLVCVQSDNRAVVADITIFGFSLGVYNFNCYSVSQTLAGAAGAGKWVSLQNGIANIAGAVGPIVIGATVEQTGSYATAFIISAAVTLVGIIGFTLKIPKIAPIAWR
jgi:cyanate permease